MTNDISPIIKAENVGWRNLLHGVSFSVSQGKITVVITAKEEVDTCLTRMILGFLAPDNGEFTIFGLPAASLPENSLLELRQRIGVVYANGGLISNLKVWENVALPLSYLNRLNSSQIEDRGVALLKRAGYTEKLMQLPGLIPFHQKKVAGFARAMLMDPDIMIYESPFFGLNQEERQFFIQTAVSFHGEKEGRTSLFLSSNTEIISMLRDATVITINQGLQS